MKSTDKYFSLEKGNEKTQKSTDSLRLQTCHTLRKTFVSAAVQADSKRSEGHTYILFITNASMP